MKKEEQEAEVIRNPKRKKETKKQNKSYFRNSTVVSIGLLLIGIFLIWKSSEILTTFSYILGGFFFAIAIVSFISYYRSRNTENDLGLNIAYGIMALLAGLFLVINPKAMASIVPLVLGLWMTISSAIKIQYAFQIKEYQPKVWTSTLIMALISLVCGVVLVFHPFGSAVAITKVIGIFLIVYSILDIVSTFVVKKQVKEFVKEIEMND